MNAEILPHTEVIPVATKPSDPEAVKPLYTKAGDRFVVQLTGSDWDHSKAAEAGLSKGMQLNAELTDAPEGDEFLLLGYRFGTGAVVAYDGDDVNNWKCKVIRRIDGEPAPTEIKATGRTEWPEERATKTPNKNIAPKREEVVTVKTTPQETVTDEVNSPAHYKSGGLEVIDVIEAFDIDKKSGHLQNVIKYGLRAGEKGDLQTDIDKLVWYAKRLQARVRENGGTW